MFCINIKTDTLLISKEEIQPNAKSGAPTVFGNSQIGVKIEQTPM